MNRQEASELLDEYFRTRKDCASGTNCGMWAIYSNKLMDQLVNPASEFTVEWLSLDKVSTEEIVGNMVYLTDGRNVAVSRVVKADRWDQDTLLLDARPPVGFYSTHYAKIPLPDNLPDKHRCGNCRWYRDLKNVGEVSSDRCWCVHERYGTYGGWIQPDESCTDWEERTW